MTVFSWWLAPRPPSLLILDDDDAASKSSVSGTYPMVRLLSPLACFSMVVFILRGSHLSLLQAVIALPEPAPPYGRNATVESPDDLLNPGSELKASDAYKGSESPIPYDTQSCRAVRECELCTELEKVFLICFDFFHDLGLISLLWAFRNRNLTALRREIKSVLNALLMSLRMMIMKS